MKTLAFVIITVTSPPQFAGQVFITNEPHPCVEFTDWIMKLAENSGGTVDTRCEYTSAPVNSPRPMGAVTRPD